MAWPTRPLEERFWEKVAKRSEDECWNLNAGLNTDGYGAFQLYIDGGIRTRTAHKVAYWLTTGIWSKVGLKNNPDTIVLRHSCNNRKCCNPKHILVGTQLNNIQDMNTQGRNGRQKVTTDQRTKIVELREQGFSARTVANMFNISTPTVYRICREAECLKSPC